MLRITGLTFSRGGRAILEGVDLELEAGGIRVLVGASGSGKTTLLRLIAGLEVPDDGRIEIGGRTASRRGEILVSPHRRRVAMAFQDGALWPHLTVESHLRFGLKHRIRMGEASDRVVEETLSMIGLTDRRHERPGRLSGGERQRLGLARALVQQPLLLLLDEPLAHVDLPTQRHLAETVLQIIRERKLSTVWVTHRPDEIGFPGGVASVLVDGRIESRTPEEMKAWLSRSRGSR